MMKLWRTRPRLSSAFVLACAVTLFFLLRLLVQTVYWQTHQQVPVQPWMTVAYVARSWGLDPRALDAKAGLPRPDVKGHPQPLIEIAHDRGVPVADIIAEVEAAVSALRTEHGK